MYESFFHLTGKPFELLPDPEFLYLSPVHRKAITYLDYGIRERAGFILMTGEVGSGKTTIIKNIIKSLDTNVNTSKIFNTSVTTHQLLSLINDDFGLEIAGKDKIALFKDLYDFLIREFEAGRHCLLLIDEAQNLSPDCLEEVRMLSNLETENSKLLQIILVGQPELRKILAATEMRQLRQRISINCHITPLDREQTEAYILHRLERAGNRNAVTFTSDSFDIIQQHTRGIPRLINIMCDFLLLSAFVEETTSLSGEMVQEIAADLQFERNYWNIDVVGDTVGDNGDRSVPEAEIISSREEELFLLTRKLGARLDVLEKASNAFVQLDELSSLTRRCVSLEEALLDLRRQVYQIAERQTATPAPEKAATPFQAPPPEVKREAPQVVLPDLPQRKGFFQSLFGRS
jgi:putative secretion ATPase (PEP-CTERM system associated)